MFPDYYEFYHPVKMVSGHSALHSLPSECRMLGMVRPMVITDAGVTRAGLVDLVLDGLGESEITVGALFDQVPADSSTDVVNAIAGLYRDKACDGLLAVGGGSVIDTAKGVNVVVSLGGDDIRAYKGADIIPSRLNPLIVIPTTAGTGSEATSAAVIGDAESHVKLSFVSQYLIPDVAVIDSRMTETLPPRLTAATAMDALAHAMEAYISIQKNPMSDALAWQAIRLIAEHLGAVIRKPHDRNLRLILANASSMAGAAFSNAMVGVVHSIGHAAGAIAGIPHGVAMAILLPHGLRFNLPARRAILGELLLPLSGARHVVDTHPDRWAEEAVRAVEDLLMDCHQQTGLAITLKQAGVTRDQFSAIAELAINDGSVLMNPTEVGIPEALQILEAAYEGIA